MHRLNKAVHIVLSIPADYIKYSRFPGSSQYMQRSTEQTHHQYLNVLSYQAANGPIWYVAIEMMYQIAIGFTLPPTSSVTTIPSPFSSWAHLTKESDVTVHTPTLIPETCCPANRRQMTLWCDVKNLHIHLAPCFRALLQSQHAPKLLLGYVFPGGHLLPAGGGMKLWVSCLLTCTLADGE